MVLVPTTRLIIVVDAARRTIANASAALVDRVGGALTFTTGLVPTGSPLGAVPTHYICNWAMSAADNADIQSRLAPLVGLGQVHVFNGLTTTPNQVLSTLGLEFAKPAGWV